MQRLFDGPKIQRFWLFLYLCVYINLPRFQKHVDNFQVSLLGCVVEASIFILLLKNKDVNKDWNPYQPNTWQLTFMFLFEPLTRDSRHDRRNYRSGPGSEPPQRDCWWSLPTEESSCLCLGHPLEHRPVSIQSKGTRPGKILKAKIHTQNNKLGVK